MNNISTKPICSIIVPAFNEELVIGKTLKSLLEGACEDEFEIIVVCNGCSDSTAAMAAQIVPHAKIITLDVASKASALNEGLAAASNSPVVFLDADIKTSAAAVRALVHRLNWSCAYLAYGCVTFETEDSSWPVQSFYKAWQQNPYFDRKKMGGLFGVSKTGLELLGRFPDILSDDEYVRRNLMANSIWVEKAPYFVQAPRTLWNLIKVRSRIYRGNTALENCGVGFSYQQKRSNARMFVQRLVRKPTLWFGALVFAFTTFAAHLKNWLGSQSSQQWDRDTSARSSATKT